jgi:hypothetical protein
MIIFPSGTIALFPNTHEIGNLFLTNSLAPHDQPILEACSAVAADNASSIIQRKIVIASRLKLTILQQLRAMNVAPHALFPTLDGLGRSLADLASLQAILLRPPREQV